MNKETTILLAGSFGIFAALGFFAIRKFIKNKRYKLYYDDYHCHFDALQEKQTADDGIEYFAFR
ncbi:hypothetical protein SAMN05421847_1508 [Halpernia humi]|uniref:Uncharacterized protein n=1 Tax=Halpernia humi TaxID=493375 RepID=A0A1H5XPM2_9FLAO|nr:hypothetical protein [Halpernia humi]SEG13709.1 hypothetical protein SAMN05421847_1508 [Halpernia humi]